MELKLAVKAVKKSDGVYSGRIDLIFPATKMEKKLFFKMEKTPFLNLGFKLSVYLDDRVAAPFLQTDDDEFGRYKSAGLALLYLLWQAIIPPVITLTETPFSDLMVEACRACKEVNIFDKNLADLILQICLPEEKNHVEL